MPIVYYDSEYYSAAQDDVWGNYDSINLNEKQNIKAWLDGTSDRTITVYSGEQATEGAPTEVLLNERTSLEPARTFFEENPLPELYIDGVEQNGLRSFYIEYGQLRYSCHKMAIGDMYVSLEAYRYHEMPLSELEKDFCDILPSVIEHSTSPLFIDGEGFKKFDFVYFDRNTDKTVSQKAMYDVSEGGIAVYFTYGAYIVKLSSDSPFHLSEAFGKIEMGDMDYNGDNTAYKLEKEYDGALYGTTEQFSDMSIRFDGLEAVKAWIDGTSDILIVDGTTESGKTKTVYESAIAEKARMYIKENGMPYLKYDTETPEYKKILMSFSSSSFGIFCDTERSDTTFSAEHFYDIPYDGNGVYEYLLAINGEYGYKYLESYDWYGQPPKVLPATFTDENGQDLKYDIVYAWSIIPCDLVYDMFCFVHNGYVINATVYEARYDSSDVIDAKHMVFDDVLNYSK